MVRPKLYKNRELVTFNTEADLYEAFKTRATVEKKSISELFQTYMEWYIDKEQARESAQSDWVYGANSPSLFTDSKTWYEFVHHQCDKAQTMRVMAACKAIMDIANTSMTLKNSGRISEFKYPQKKL